MAVMAVLCGGVARADETVSERENCAITGLPPTRPPSLSFCNKFNNLACCPPGQDATIADNFKQLTGAGRGQEGW